MFFLQAINGPWAGQRYDLSGETATIGRHPDCEIALKDAGRVSRHHAQIVRDANAFYVVDLGSRNGTFVNNEVVTDQRHVLRHGDRLSVCDICFLVQDEVELGKRAGDTGSVDLRRATDGSGISAVWVDDETPTASKSTIMSKVEVSSGADGSVRVSASLQARMAALIEITRSLGKALILDEVLPQVLRSLSKIFLQADRGFIVLRSPTGELVPRHTWTRKQEGEETIRISRTIVRHVMDTRDAILSADASRDERLDMSQSIADLRIRSVMCAPLLDSEGNALGVIQLDTLDQRKRFQQDDLEVLASVAVQAGIAIDNAQLHENALRQKEMEHDLKLAYEVQKSFLPQAHPQVPGYDFFEFYKPASHVGGDYYDYIALPDGRTAVVVADVVGHGVAAAMLMAKLSAEAKFCLASESEPAAALIKLNDLLSTLQIERFVTVVLVVLDPVSHEVTLVNAGHMAPIWRRADGSLQEPGSDVAGLPVGIAHGYPYEQEKITLGPGEWLVMYTDGINEAMSPAGDLFTIERLRQHLRLASGCLTTVGEDIVADVRRFIGPGPQTDDMCLVGLARLD